nr:MAG TPA: hypothetical protein [Caudoviricetes sp.]
MSQPVLYLRFLMNSYICMKASLYFRVLKVLLNIL